jgi:PIN domain nuclease of toxin-antitoxin system
VKLLLDTHSFLWFIDGNSKLSSTARGLIENPGSERLLSIASVWELAIKHSIGRLQLAQPFHLLLPQQLALNDISLLGISLEHTAIVATLPFHHKDPFDRLIVAQSLAEQIPVISTDPALDAYGVTRLW